MTLTVPSPARSSGSSAQSGNCSTTSCRTSASSTSSSSAWMRINRSRRRRESASRAAGRAARRAGRRRSGSRRRSARRGSRRRPGSRTRPRVPPTPRSRRSAPRSRGVSARNVTSVVSVCSSSQAGVRRQSPETTSCVRPASDSSIALGLRRVGGLAEQLAVEQHLGVDAEHRPLAAVDRARLARRALERARAGHLVEVGRDDLERDAELRQDRAPLRRRRREDERRCRCSAHAILRATQISSHGHCRAHSAVT